DGVAPLISGAAPPGSGARLVAVADADGTGVAVGGSDALLLGVLIGITVDVGDVEGRGVEEWCADGVGKQRMHVELAAAAGTVVAAKPENATTITNATKRLMARSPAGRA